MALAVCWRLLALHIKVRICHATVARAMMAADADHAIIRMLLAVHRRLTAFHDKAWLLRAGRMCTAPVADVDHAVLSMNFSVRRCLADGPDVESCRKLAVMVPATPHSPHGVGRRNIPGTPRQNANTAGGYWAGLCAPAIYGIRKGQLL